MNYHIVRTNETIEKIAFTYNFNVNELKNINMHIKNWNNLIPGTRLKLPPIPEVVSDEINDIEPFIEDYYPKIDVDKYESKVLNTKISNTKVSNTSVFDTMENDSKKEIETDQKELDNVEEELKTNINYVGKDNMEKQTFEKIEKNGNFLNLPKYNSQPTFYYYPPYDPYAYYPRQYPKKRTKK